MGALRHLSPERLDDSGLRGRQATEFTDGGSFKGCRRPLFRLPLKHPPATQAGEATLPRQGDGLTRPPALVPFPPYLPSGSARARGLETYRNALLPRRPGEPSEDNAGKAGSGPSQGPNSQTIRTQTELHDQIPAEKLVIRPIANP